MPNFSALPSAALGRTLVALFLLALRFPAAGQAPTWQSARAVAVATGAATSNTSNVTATAVDAAGNVFLAGSFTNTVVLGSTTLTSFGDRDVFVAKFSPASNQFVWAQRAGGPSYDQATALAVNGPNVYVAGSFLNTTVFGVTTLSSAGGGDVFVAKLTDAGSNASFGWAQRAGGTDSDQATALAVNGSSVYVAGAFYSFTASFGATTLTNATSTLPVAADVFVTKLTDAGNTSSFVWTQRAGSTGFDQASALAVSGPNVYVAGTFDSPAVSFGAGVLTSAGGLDGFVTKLTDAGSTGSFGWAQLIGGSGNDQPTALAASGTSVYVAGAFRSSTIGFGATALTNAGFWDVFVAKLTDAGTTSSFTWAQRAGGADLDVAYALAVSGSSLFVAGSFSLTATFGSTTLTTNLAGDAFVAKLTDAGNTSSFLWAQGAGGTAQDEATALAINGTSVWVAGYMRSATASFGSNSLTNPNLGNSLGFLASLTDPTLTATTAALPREPATLFPNPARHVATLRLPAGTVPAPLTLTDALGRPVRRYPAPAGPETTLDLRGLPAGLYLLRGAGPAQRLVVE